MLPIWSIDENQLGKWGPPQADLTGKEVYIGVGIGIGIEMRRVDPDSDTDSDPEN